MPEPKGIQKAAFAVTRWIGSTESIFVHTIVFSVVIAILLLHLFSFDVVILIFNTAVSLEAIYLALFIQMTVNFQSQSIEEFGEDIEEIQEDIGEIQEDVDELQEDVEDIEENDDEEEKRRAVQHKTLTDIQADLRKLMGDIERLQKNPPTKAAPLE